MADSSKSRVANSPHTTMSVTPICFCGSVTVYQDSAAYYHGHSYGMRWICSRWPECDGSVGAHPDGKPLGTVPSHEDKKYRSLVHAQIDPLWENQARSKKRARGSVYGWLRRILNLTADECHVGNWDADQCIEALEQIALHPYEHRHETVTTAMSGELDKHTEGIA